MIEPEDREICVDLRGMDWPRLRSQAESLHSIKDDCSDTSDTIELHQEAAIDGVLNLIAFIQEKAASVLGAQEVYGTEVMPRRAINDP